MVDYSKLSDVEIAQKVFFWVNDKICQNGGLAHFFNGEFVYSSSGSALKKFDPCNNPADAWPIIDENKICLLSIGNTWRAHDLKLMSQDSNPLRAAMIVFLMMQDAKNG